MTEQQLLAQLHADASALAFSQVIAVIDATYDYHPTAFSNGPVNNDAGQNGGSCKVLSFAQRHQLSADLAVALFAEHYRKVIATPDDDDHANIRAFMQSGWQGVVFRGDALTSRNPA